MRSQSRRASRRDVLVVAGLGLLAAGCGASSVDPTKTELRQLPPAARAGEVETLNAGLAIENRLIAAYTAVIPMLSGFAMSAAQQFLGQEVSHAGELAGLVREAKAMPALPASSYDLGSPRNTAQALALLHSIEGTMIAFYLDAIPRLPPGLVRATLASILANEGQHVAVLRVAQGEDPVPSAFVTGTE